MKVPFLNGWIFWFLVITRDHSVAEKYEALQRGQAHLRRNPKKKQTIQPDLGIEGEERR